MLFMHSYTYRGQPLARAARKCREYGYDGLELVTLHYDRNDPESSIAQAAETASAAGTRIAVVDFSAPLGAAESGEREQAVASVTRILQLAAQVGARGINGSTGSLVGPDPNDWSANGSRLATPEHYEQAAESLRRLAPVAADLGLWISLEIHMNTLHDTAVSARRLLDLVDHAAVIANLDPGNMYGVADAEPIPEALEALGPRLGYVHLKNCRELAGQVDYSWPLDFGDIDYYQGLAAIVHTGYAGDYCIEYCGRGDPRVAARRDAVYFRETLAEARAS